jgi:hypothetical protein
MFHIKHRVLFTVHGVGTGNKLEIGIGVNGKNTGQQDENRNRYYWQ